MGGLLLQSLLRLHWHVHIHSKFLAVSVCECACINDYVCMCVRVCVDRTSPLVSNALPFTIYHDNLHGIVHFFEVATSPQRNVHLLKLSCGIEPRLCTTCRASYRGGAGISPLQQKLPPPPPPPNLEVDSFSYSVVY